MSVMRVDNYRESGSGRKKAYSRPRAGLPLSRSVASVAASPSRRGSHSIDDSNRGEVSTRRCGPGVPRRFESRTRTRTPFIDAHNGRGRTHRGMRGARGRDRTQASNVVVMTEVDSRVSACVLVDRTCSTLSKRAL